MRRFVIDQISDNHDKVIITGSEARHIAKVLRMDRGDKILLMDTQGRRYEAVIVAIHLTQVEVKLLRPAPAPYSPPVDLTLCQALLKAKAMDMVIQKATELGVTSIIPFVSERTVVRLDGTRAANKLRHWKEIARNATAQSNRSVPPEILPIMGLTEILESRAGPDTLSMVLWEQERCNDLKTVLRTQDPKKKIVALVGPEGGFSRSEIEHAVNGGFVVVSLGQRIVRAETAGMVLCALILYEWGDLGS